MASETVLPDGWRMVRFGEVVRNVNDNERDPQEAGIERYVGLDDLDPESLHVRRWGNVEEGTSFTRLFRPGQVLFGKRRAYQRKAAVADFEGVCSGDILVFEADETYLIPELLPFLVQTDSFFKRAIGTSAGSLSPRTKWKDLAKYEFPLPTKNEQRRIAEVLWAANEAVERQRHLASTLTEAKIAVFEEMITRSRDSTRPGPLSNYTLLISDGDHNPPPRQPKGIPHVVVKNIVDRRIDLSDCTFISASDYERVKKRYEPRTDDLLVTCVGSVGRPALVPQNLVFSADRSLAVIRFDQKRVNPRFGIELIESRSVQRQIDRHSTGTAQQHLYLKQIRNLEVSVPTLDRQDEIVRVMAEFDAAIQQAKSSSHHAAHLRAVLINRIAG